MSWLCSRLYLHVAFLHVRHSNSQSSELTPVISRLDDDGQKLCEIPRLGISTMISRCQRLASCKGSAHGPDILSTVVASVELLGKLNAGTAL